jgi:hypothetical protein
MQPKHSPVRPHVPLPINRDADGNLSAPAPWHRGNASSELIGGGIPSMLDRVVRELTAPMQPGEVRIRRAECACDAHGDGKRVVHSFERTGNMVREEHYWIDATGNRCAAPADAPEAETEFLHVGEWAIRATCTAAMLRAEANRGEA